MSAWLNPIWKTVQGKARMARRKVSSVKKYSSEADLMKEAKDKHLHVAQAVLHLP